MRSERDILVVRPLRRVWLRPACLLISASLALALLSGCRLSFGARPMAVREPTPEPRVNLTPTIQIVSSAELYGEDSRAVGETSRGLASFPAGAVLPPIPVGDSDRRVTVLVDASTSIQGELFKADTFLQPGVLVLGEDLSAWGKLPDKLSDSGYETLVLQIDSSTQARQIETMLQSLIALPGVDAGVIAVIGSGRAADLALLGCAVNSLCDAVALLSPLSRDTLLNVLPSYGARPLWLAAGHKDSEAYGTASALAAEAQGETRFVLVAEGRGASMLQLQPDLQDELLVWLKSQLGV